MAGQSRIGVTGLAVMGANLARNIAHHDVPVAVHNRTQAKTDELIQEHGGEGNFTPASSLPELVDAIQRPRPIIIMVKAGRPVDAVIEEILPHLDEGDILIDGGNSLFTDTQRRVDDLAGKGIRFLGTGISGGEEGALNGPSMMPGGSRDAYGHVESILTSIAAQVDGTPCCTFIGPDGAGHYVKMVHNGIEYADMQLIAESYDLLSNAAGLDAFALADVFASWKEGDLDSYLIEITAQVLRKKDESTGRPLVDMIVDEAEQKGTGRWTVTSALDLGVPTTGIAEAVFARMLSARRAERQRASRILAGPSTHVGAADEAFVDMVRDALYASKVVAYAQGFQQMAAASAAQQWNLDLRSIATIWRGGCIIRARFLDRIREAYEHNPDIENLLFEPYFQEAVAGAQDAWRNVVSVGVQRGIPTPAFSSSLAYYDGLRRERGPANLIQGLRDYFGAHTYHRNDREGAFHTRWGQDGKQVETV
ncbi:MAG: NADP-dependent phosphogluconate dehydrogenase [Chloroflexota bacterium]